MGEEARWCETCGELTAHDVPGAPVLGPTLLVGALMLGALASPWPWLAAVPFVIGLLLGARELRFTRIACGRCQDRARRATGALLFSRATEISGV